MRLAVDTWAFLEIFFSGHKRREVEEALVKADGLVTSREVVVETCNFIAGRTGRTEPAIQWLRGMRAGRTRIVEHPMSEIEAFLGNLPTGSTLSYADASLALVADRESIAHVASEDGGFRKAHLAPIFAKASRRT